MKNPGYVRRKIRMRKRLVRYGVNVAPRLVIVVRSGPLPRRRPGATGVKGRGNPWVYGSRVL